MSYDKFGSITAAKRHYRRARSLKHFILEPVPKRAPRCACCGLPINDFAAADAAGKALHPVGYQSNRCEYWPRAKTVRAFHYVCIWTRNLEQVAKLKPRA